MSLASQTIAFSAEIFPDACGKPNGGLRRRRLSESVAIGDLDGVNVRGAVKEHPIGSVSLLEGERPQGDSNPCFQDEDLF